MPRRKEAEQFAVVEEKDCWHLYGLQDLGPNKFAKVVGNVLTHKDKVFIVLVVVRWQFSFTDNIGKMNQNRIFTLAENLI